MREFWIRLNPTLSLKQKQELIRKTKDECSVYLVDNADENLARQCGARKVASAGSGEIRLLNSVEEAFSVSSNGKKCISVKVASAEDEKRISEAIAASIDYIIVECSNWKVIPLENTIAAIYGKSKLIAHVSDGNDAALALQALELGVDGVLVELSEPKEIGRIWESCSKVTSRITEKQAKSRLALTLATIIETMPLRSGARTCVDTCDLMKEGEGMLVGCQASALFLIQAETEENPFINSRPFRVNAGAVAQYFLTQEFETRYLSETKIGDEVMIVSRNGGIRSTNVCRTKVEWRPLLLIEAACGKRVFSTIVQNAETIRLVTKNGTKSVKELTKGDEVLVFMQEGGRHFGRLVPHERVIEQ